MPDSSQTSDKVSLYIDEPETEKILLDFPNYIMTLHQIMLNSTPQYTIGIFGDWGTGKTTLMRNVALLLEDDDCNCFEFNAWRFAHEDRHATYPLMLSILSKLLENDKVKKSLEGGKLQKLKSKLWRVVKGLKGSVTLKIPETADFTLEIDPSLMTPEENKFSNISDLFEKSKPVLQEGIELITELLSEINGPAKNKDLKLVVFIDDLDRCTPEKATEIFESVKVFFDISGIVFVFGLSQLIIESAINYKYDHLKSNFNGKDYLKKIIQVPFPLPQWSESDIEKFIIGLIEKNENPQYADFIRENKSLIAQGVKNNPREVKRLLNNFILSTHIQKEHADIDLKKFLMVLILSLRWRSFYDLISEYPHLLTKIAPSWKKKLLDVAVNLGEVGASSAMSGGVGFSNPEKTPLDNEIDKTPDLKRFLYNQGDTLFSISEKEWEIFRRATIVEPNLDYLEKIRSKPKNIKLEIPVMIHTDKSVYSSGEKITVYGTVSDILEGVPVTLDVVNSTGKLISLVDVTVGLDKSFHTDLPITDLVKSSEGKCTVRAIYGNDSQANFTTFELLPPNSKSFERESESTSSHLELEWLRQKAYEPIYDQLMPITENPTNLEKIPPNPWETLEPSVKLQLDDDLANLLKEYDGEIRKWKNMLSELEHGFTINSENLSEILKPAFQKANMISQSDGMIVLTENSRQEVKDWINAFKMILFDDTINSGSSLFHALEKYSDQTKNGMKPALNYWKKHYQNIFEYIIDILPALRQSVKITVSNDQLSSQKECQLSLIKKITNLLEKRLKSL